HSPSAAPVPNSSTGKTRNWNRPKNSIRYTGATPNSHTQAQESAHTSRYAASHMRAARENSDLLQRFINGLPLCAVVRPAGGASRHDRRMPRRVFLYYTKGTAAGQPVWRGRGARGRLYKTGMIII